MKQIYKTIMAVLIILSLVVTIGSAINTIGWAGYTGLPTTVSSTTTNMYIQVCCIEQQYMTSDKYFQLPITVKILNRSMKPVGNVKVNVNIINGLDTQINPETWMNVTKTTGSNGIVEFGYSKLWDGAIYGDVRVEVTAKKNSDVASYSKIIQVVMD